MNISIDYINNLLNNKFFSTYLENELINNNINIILGYEIFDYLKIYDTNFKHTITNYVFDPYYNELEIKSNHMLKNNMGLQLLNVCIHMNTDLSMNVEVNFYRPSAIFKLNLMYISENDKFYVNTLNIRNGYSQDFDLEVTYFVTYLINKNEQYLKIYYHIISTVLRKLNNG